MFNGFDLPHFSILHSVAFASSIEQILMKTKFNYFIHKIIHLDFKEFKTNIPGENDRSTKHATISFTITPILIGIDLTSFKIIAKVKKYPPMVTTCLELPRFGIKCYFLATFTPVAPNKLASTELYFHQGNLGSKILAKMVYTLGEQIVILIGFHCLYNY